MLIFYWKFSPVSANVKSWKCTSVPTPALGSSAGNDKKSRTASQYWHELMANINARAFIWWCMYICIYLHDNLIIDPDNHSPFPHFNHFPLLTMPIYQSLSELHVQADTLSYNSTTGRTVSENGQYSESNTHSHLEVLVLAPLK